MKEKTQVRVSRIIMRYDYLVMGPIATKDTRKIATKGVDEKGKTSKYICDTEISSAVSLAVNFRAISRNKRKEKGCMEWRKKVKGMKDRSLLSMRESRHANIGGAQVLLLMLLLPIRRR